MPANAQKRTIAVFTPSALGGHARYTRELLEALAEVGRGRGFRPSLITSEDLASEYRSSAYPIHDILPRLAFREEFRSTPQWAGSRLSHYRRREACLLRWVDTQPGLALIHFQEHTPWLARGLFRALRKRGIAVVETVHNIKKHRYFNRLHRVVHDSIERNAWRACDALCVHTEGLVAELSARLGPDHPPIHVTPHGVWSLPEAPGHVLEPELAREGPLLFFGVIRPNKGLHVLMDAMKFLPGHRLIVAGHPEPPGYMDMIREKVEQIGPGRVEVIERFVSESEAAELFERCGLVVMPYTSFASQSGVLHQALAHSRPVVVSDVGALGESVRNWGIGEVIPAQDEQALATAIVSALDPTRYRQYVAANERVREELSWTRTAERTLDVYDSALRSNPRLDRITI